MMPSLSVLVTLADAYGTVFKNLGAIIRAALFPALGLAILTVVEDAVAPGRWLSMLFWLLALPLVILITIAIHRIALLGPDSLANEWSLSWTSRETTFTVWFIYMVIFLGASAWVAGWFFWGLTDWLLASPVSWVIALLTWATVAWLQGRFGMVFPVAALGKRTFFSRSWLMTAGNGARIAICLMIPWLIYVGVNALTGFATTPTASTAMDITVVVTAAITWAVEIAVLSVVYKFLRDNDL